MIYTFDNTLYGRNTYNLIQSIVQSIINKHIRQAPETRKYKENFHTFIQIKPKKRFSQLRRKLFYDQLVIILHWANMVIHI